MTKDRLVELHEKYLAGAIHAHKQHVNPNEDGTTCGWCDKYHEWCDDIGFHYLTPQDDDTRVSCEDCHRGLIGKMHEARYGIGNR